MNIIKAIKKITPFPVKRFIRVNLNNIFAKIKEPRMVWGYHDSTGVWRPRTRISDTVFMYHPEKIRIGDNVFVWHYTILDGTGGLVLGEGSQIGAWVGIFTHSSHIAIRIYGNHYQEVPEHEKKGYPINSVNIGKYVFVGAGAKILPGVTVGNGALISAGSIVSRDVDEFEIVSGNPAESVGDTRKIDNKYLNDPLISTWYDEWQKR